MNSTITDSYLILRMAQRALNTKQTANRFILYQKQIVIAANDISYNRKHAIVCCTQRITF